MIHEQARVLIRAEGLYKNCRLGKETVAAVRNLDIRIRQGEFVMLRGISGSRKNSLFNLLGCLERQDAGKYYFDYEDIGLSEESMLEDIRRSRIGYLFRDFRLIDRLTVYQNIEVPTHGLDVTGRERADRVGAALKEAGIERIAEDKAGRLSDFDKQLVGLARAVVNHPLMLVADEPSANLSADEEELLMGYLQGINKKGTVILLFTSKNNIRLPGGCRVLTFNDGILYSDREEEGWAFDNGGAI